MQATSDFVRAHVLNSSTKQLLIAKISDCFEETVVAESNGRIEIYF